MRLVLPQLRPELLDVTLAAERRKKCWLRAKDAERKRGKHFSRLETVRKQKAGRCGRPKAEQLQGFSGEPTSWTGGCGLEPPRLVPPSCRVNGLGEGRVERECLALGIAALEQWVSLFACSLPFPCHRKCPVRLTEGLTDWHKGAQETPWLRGDLSLDLPGLRPTP